MVVVYRAHGYRFVIYTLDHEPAHVHAIGAGFAKINLKGAGGMPELMSSSGMKQSDMRRVFAAVVERRAEFLQAWECIHDRAD